MLEIERQQEAPVVGIRMYDQPLYPDYKVSKIAKLAEERLEILNRVRLFMDQRKDQETKTGYFYDELGQLIEQLIERSVVFSSRVNDVVSHWLCKVAFAKKDLWEDSMFAFFEKILFAGRIWNMASKEASKKLKSERTQVTVEAEEGTFNSENEKFDFERNKFFFGMLCEYIGVKTETTNKTNHYFRLKQGSEVTVASRKVGYVMVPWRFALKPMEGYECNLSAGRAQITPYTAFMVVQEVFDESLKVHRNRILKNMSSIVEPGEPLSYVCESLVVVNEELKKENAKPEKRWSKFEFLDYTAIYSVVSNFPLCMRDVHDSLMKNHTLKHFGRIQYISFLKEVGLEVKQTVKMFVAELNKCEKGRQQVKEYQYLIEHMYGLQGKKESYNAYGCAKLISKGVPSNNEVWGCPYKYYSDKALAKSLEVKMGLKGDEIDQVLQSRAVEPQKGCRKVFELKHPNYDRNKGVGKHPNGYFHASYSATQKEQFRF